MIRSKLVPTVILVSALVLVFQAGPVRADGAASEAGVGAASAVTTLIYGPVKMVYSVLGVIFGGFAWGLSGGDSDVMMAVVTPAVRGDYVVTPNHIRGERSLEFFGRSPDYREDTVVLEEVY